MNEIEVKLSVILYADEINTYTKRCIESFQMQTVADLEIIICIGTEVPKRDYDYLHELSKNLKMYQVIQGKGKKEIELWKDGVSVSRGKYILFFNIKDFADSNMLKNITLIIEEQAPEAIIVAYENFDTTMGIFSKEPECYSRYAESERDIKFFPRIKIGNILFKREFIQQQMDIVQFDELYYGLNYLYLNLARAERISVKRSIGVYFRKKQEEYKKNISFWLELLNIYESVFKSFSGNNCKVKNIFRELFCCDMEEMLELIKNRESLILVSEVLKEKIYKPFASDAEKSIFDAGIIQEIFALARTYQKRYMNFQKQEIQLLHEADVGRNPDISVIIPAYNVETELRGALASIVGQTLKNIEIICINDGSTDGTLDVLRECADKDKRISVYTQPNCGQSVARNRGAEKARGKYIYFMDSDDLLNRLALEFLYKQSKENNLDVLYFDAEAFSDENIDKLEEYQQYYKRTHAYSQKVYTGLELLHQMCKNKEYIVSPCLQLISKEHWDKNRLRFHEGIIHEDNEFNFLCAVQAEKVAYCPIPFFKRRIRANSTMIQKKTFEHVYGYYACYKEVLRWLELHQIESRYDSTIAQILDNMLHGLRSAYDAIAEDERFAINALNISEQIALRHLLVNLF